MKSIFLILFLLTCTFGFASDSILLSCKYRFVKQKDSTNVNSKFDDIMILEIGKGKSKYYSYLKQYGNKLLKDYINNLDKNNTTLNINGDNANKFFPLNESEIIDLNFGKKSVYVSDNLASSYYAFNDTLIAPNWKLGADTLTILNQKCQSATTTLKGRNYTAWFATSIPLNNGPWYFFGLPGLILKIEDDKNQFQFECIGLSVSKAETDVFRSYENVILVPKSILNSKKRLLAKNVGAFLQSENGVTFTPQGGNGISERRPNKPYNPIDLTQ